MIFEHTYKDVVNSFGSLWKFRERGDTLEIITPFATTNHRFPSLFLSKRETEFVISDGGWIADQTYDVELDKKGRCFNKIFVHYQAAFEIKSVTDKIGNEFFYKKVANEIEVASAVLDMCTFVSSIISACHIDFEDRDAVVERRFNHQVKEYLTSHYSDREWHFNEYLDSSTKKIRPSAILQKKQNRLVIINFITGSTPDYFRTSISKTSIIFGLADQSVEAKLIDNKVALLDDASNGYRLDRVSNWLDYVVTTNKCKRLEWKNRRDLINF